MRLAPAPQENGGEIECIHIRPLNETEVLKVLKKDNLYTIIRSSSDSSYEFCKSCQYLSNSSSRVWWYSFSHAQNLLETLNGNLFFNECIK